MPRTRESRHLWPGPVRSLLAGMLALAAFLHGEASLALDHAACIGEIHAEAVALGLNDGHLQARLRNLGPDPRVIRLDRGQPERKLSFAAYAQRLLTPARLADGRAALSRNRALMQNATSATPIEAELLTALWGLETDYGRNLGGFDSLQALLTLGCDDRRPAFFRREVLALLRLLENGRLPLAEPMGSWAGAMGHLQFLPSVVLEHGVDADRDGRIDIYRESADLFATAAGFLTASGWRMGEPWGLELDPASTDCPDHCRHESSRQWRALALRRKDGGPLPRLEGPASILRFDGAGGRSFMLLPNSEALLRWNRSNYYVVAVGLLFDQLQGEAQFDEGGGRRAK